MTLRDIHFERTLVDKSIKTEPMSLSFGPLHPATRSGLRLALELEGERISSARSEIGFCHRGVEKEAEARDWAQIVPLMSRLNYYSPPIAEAGYCMAVEALSNIEIPDRAAWLRMLYSELSRIADHLIAVSDVLIHCGMIDATQQLMEERESIVRWFGKSCGSRIMSNVFTVGGCVRDLSNDARKLLPKRLKEITRATATVRNLIKENRLFADRTHNMGVISLEDACAWGITGPNARASGMEYDVRRANPYYFYNDLEWNVVLGENGDTYDRVIVRLEEISQSVHIIEQILDRIPRGPIHTESKIEDGSVYSSTEAANGELGFLVVSDGSNKPYRLHIRAPSFPLAQIYPNLINGLNIGDAIVVLSSLHVVAGEVDR